MRLTTALGFLLVFLLSLVGCGPSGDTNTAHLRGKITLKGAALPENARGSVTFRPVDLNSGKAVTVQIVGSEYDSPATPRGAVKAYIEISAPTGKKIKSERTGEVYDELASILPPNAQRGIDINVSEDNLAHDFSLE